MVAGDRTGARSNTSWSPRHESLPPDQAAREGAERRAQMSRIGKFSTTGSRTPAANSWVGDEKGVLWMSHRATPELAHSFLEGRCD